ncbi:hypothetical protein CHARACLAT_022129, partial [Characodon lateralis]|nr:hypothetical protein [Characodon lateralis]
KTVIYATRPHEHLLGPNLISLKDLQRNLHSVGICYSDECKELELFISCFCVVSVIDQQPVQREAQLSSDDCRDRLQLLQSLESRA